MVDRLRTMQKRGASVKKGQWPTYHAGYQWSQTAGRCKGEINFHKEFVLRDCWRGDSKVKLQQRLGGGGAGHRSSKSPDILRERRQQRVPQRGTLASTGKKPVQSKSATEKGN